MGVPRWEFHLTDLLGEELGELTDVNTRAVVLPLNQLPTASFKIPVMHPLSPYLSDPTWDGLVKAYRTSSAGVRTLAFHGPVVSTEEVGDSSGPPMIAVSASSAMWRLNYRLLGTSSAGWTKGNASTTFDLTQIVESALDDSNASGYTGIEFGGASTTEQGAAGTYYMKPTLQAIAEISVGINAFDFEVAPCEPTPVAHQFWPQIGTLNAVALIGTNRPDAIFEFGTTKANVTSYNRQLDRTNLLNQAWINQPSATDHSGILASNDATSIATRGLFEGLVDDGGTTWDVLRQAIADQNVAVRKQARQLVSFVPFLNASPEPLVDYIVGDVIRLRLIVNGVTRIDGTLRVWGISFAIDDNGNETPTLTTIQS